MRTLHHAPGRYEGNGSQLMARVAHDASMDSSETVGDVTEVGWFAALVRGKRFVFIVLEDSQGFVNVTAYHKDDPEWSADWRTIEEGYEADTWKEGMR